jgi:hypothetical protein
MSALKLWARRALLAALLSNPIPVLAEIAARLDIETGTVVLSGLAPDERKGVLADPDLLRLQVASSKSNRGMLVSLVRDSGDILIIPRFPLRSGTDYTLKLDLPQSRFETILTSPASKADAPQLIAFAPSQSVIPANILRLYLTFSQPMNSGQLRQSVTLLRADGTVVPNPFLNLETELWDSAQTRATLLLDPGRIKQGVGPNASVGAPLEDGKRYRLIVSGTMHSAAGQPIGDDVSITLRIGPPERQTITPDTWQILLPQAGSRLPLTVAFDRIIDSGAVRRLLTLHAPDGNLVQGQVTTDGGGWSLSPDAPWQPGLYILKVDPELEDVSGNTIGAPFDAKPGTIGLRTDPALLSINIPSE